MSGEVDILAVHEGWIVNEDVIKENHVIKENQARFVAAAGTVGVRVRLNGMRKMIGLPPELTSLVANYAGSPLSHWDCWRKLGPAEARRLSDMKWPSHRLDSARKISNDRRGLLIDPGTLQFAIADKTIGELATTWSVNLTIPTRGGVTFFYLGLMRQPLNQFPSFGITAGTRNNKMHIYCSSSGSDGGMKSPNLYTIDGGLRSLHRNICIRFLIDVTNRSMRISSEKWRHEGGDAVISNLFSIPHLADYRLYALAGLQHSVTTPMHITIAE